MLRCICPLEEDERVELKRSVRDSELSIFGEAVAIALMTLGRGEIPRGKYWKNIHYQQVPFAWLNFQMFQCHRHV